MYTNGGIEQQITPMDEEEKAQLNRRANELFYVTFFASLMLVLSFALWITYLATA